MKGDPAEEIIEERIEILRMRIGTLEALLDRERLADHIHREWISWASEILRTEPGISIERRARWARLIVTPYADLSETEKAHDRKWADRIRTA